MTFQLDTSGVVELRDQKLMYRFQDLTPFQQGYTAAALAGPIDFGNSSALQVGFSDLAPATLGRILEDCRVAHEKRLNRPDGKWLWLHRQSGLYEDFPPLVVSLGDDGLVYLTEGVE